ncbi:hypothetical protein AVEN_13248-1 [Araneus ventricosus]|uniref:Uncharacterized protein n=1 Tax=Araneus ventricosus TaxID=182803 RepID=A0A4Y2DKP6_ARAVE|nr:hypothetical protein AVEN_13248-1 [Araneus ventricosus]
MRTVVKVFIRVHFPILVETNDSGSRLGWETSLFRTLTRESDVSHLRTRIDARRERAATRYKPTHLSGSMSLCGWIYSGTQTVLAISLKQSMRPSDGFEISIGDIRCCW